jgi:GNAT superfamily N-acetyltransferase
MDPIFANHLLFIRRHRGDYAQTDRSVTIVSEAPGFTSWVPLAPDADRPTETDAVRLLPESGGDWSNHLDGAEFKPAEQLSYQSFDLSSDLERGHPGGSVSIQYGQTVDDALVFAEIQSRGFLEKSGEATDWWKVFFPFVAVRNIFDPQQDFLIASASGKPAAVLLLISNNKVSGIYAVATRPEARRQGVSTALLHEAANRARDRGSDSLVLQALVGSYAEGFYKRLGFSERYISTVWRRT